MLSETDLKNPMNQRYSIRARLGPSLGIQVRNWMKLIITNGLIAFKYYPRVFLVNLVSTIGIPFRIYERWKWDKEVEKTNLKKPPIFILGHWRSGTTHLHNLMVKDPQFGFITMLQAAFPKSFMSNNFFRSFMKIFLPKTRPMDNMKMGIDEAQEEEMALGNLFPYSFYNGWYFPRKMMEYYFKFIRFENISRVIKEQWKKVYQYLLKKATLNMRGKQLVLKNPANTGRVKMLLELYPDAKFIHIYRNPYIVYNSTQILYQKMIQAFMLQEISQEEIEKNIFKIYKEMMISYFNESKLIPKDNLVEVRFEDLETNAIKELERIYNSLSLNGFDNVKETVKSYLKTLTHYKKNKISLNKQLIEKIEKNWKFTIDKWDYLPPKSTL